MTDPSTRENAARPERWFPLLSVLAAELGPFPGRWRFALRVSLACVIVAVTAMTLRTPLTWVPLYLCFALSRETAAETFLGGVLLMGLAVVGVAVALLGLHAAPEPAWLRLGLLALLMTGGLFMDRATVIPLAGPNLALVWGMIFTLPDTVPLPEIWVRFCLWFIPLAALGAGAAAAAALLLPPADPLRRLLDELAGRVAGVEAVVRQRCGGDEARPGAARGGGRTRRGASALTGLVRLIEIQHPRVKRSPVDLRGLITLVDRLQAVAESLRLLPPAPLTPGQRARLGAAAEGCSRLRRVLTTRRPPPAGLWPEEALLPGEAPRPGADAGVLPAAFEMERLLKDIALAFRSRDPDLSPPEPKPERIYGIFLADAFSNPAHIRFALKGTLAAFACYFLYTASDYSEIHTSLVTCMVVALSTSGAVIHKMALRITGACVGGLMALASVVFLVPHMESVASLCLLVGAGSLIAAWVAAGSERISYAGWQIGLAFFMTVIQGSGPADDLTVIRDRLIGILLGNLMMGLVFTFVFPERAGAAMWRALAACLRVLARLAEIPDPEEGTRAVLRRAEPLRRRFAEELKRTHAMAEQAVFEPRAFSPEGRAARQGAVAVASEAESLWLLLQAVLLHRDDARMKEVPPEARREALAFHRGLRDALEDAARVLEGGPPGRGAGAAGLDAGLARAEAAMREAAAGISEETAAQMEGRIALYRRMAASMRRLSEGASGLAQHPWWRG